MKTLKTFLITTMIFLFTGYNATAQGNIDLTSEHSPIETGDIADKTDSQNAFMMPRMNHDEGIFAYEHVSFRPDSIGIEVRPSSSSSLSLYGSTLLLASVINCSYEWIKYGQKYHNGFTTGMTYSTVLGEGYDLGAHLTYTLLIGNTSNYFEMKLGFVYNFLRSEFFTFVPVISLGYRYQPPENLGFFRIGLSTAGLGVGFGVILGSTKNSK
jgi:hypothetical protein